MDKYRLAGGILLLVASGIFMLATDVVISIPISLMVVGIALIATSRKKRRLQ